MTHTVRTVQLCIDRCARAKDGRGRWRAYRDCYTALARVGDDAIAMQTAAAARRIGEFLAAPVAATKAVA